MPVQDCYFNAEFFRLHKCWRGIVGVMQIVVINSNNRKYGNTGFVCGDSDIFNELKRLPQMGWPTMRQLT